MLTRIRRLTALVGATALAGFLMTGGASAQSLQTKVLADLEKYRSVPEFTPAGEPFDAKACMAGKSIISIPSSSSIPFLASINATMGRIAKDIGFKFQVWENQGQPTQWSQGLQFAITNKFSLVDLLGGTDPRVLGPQVNAARDAGAIVTASHMTGFEQDVPSGVSAAIPIDYKQAGRLLAEWTIAKTGGKTNAIVLVANEVMSTDSMMAGIEEVFADCPDCKYSVVNVPIPDWATKVQSNVQSAVIADPAINYIITIYDSMSQFVVPALTITGSTDRVKIATFNGTPFVLDMIRNGQVEMDIGENLDWIAYGLLDAQMRLLCGLEPVKDPKIPLMIFDAKNVESAGVPAESSKGYGDAYLTGYKYLWKL